MLMARRTASSAVWYCFFFFILLIWEIFIRPVSGQAQPQIGPDVKAHLTSGQRATAAGVFSDLSQKNVLLLHAYTYETVSCLIVDPVFVKGFTDAGLDAFNLHFEFMDVAKHPDPKHREELVQYLSRKFEKRPFDLIIALHNPALNFLVEEGKNLFPGVPVINVIAGAEFLHDEDLRSAYERRTHSLQRPFVILPYSTNVKSTVESILNLQPDTGTLVVISGSGFLDQIMEQATRRYLQAWQGKLPIEYFEALPLEEVIKRVGTLAPKTAILFTNFSADPDGKVYSPPEVVQRISRAANAPIFGLFDTLLEKGGIVGGVMLSHRNEAARTVKLALEILRGSLPTERVTVLPSGFIPMFDWEQLKRWGMNEERLPPGNIVLNRPKTIWSEYKGLVVAGIAVFLAQTLLVIGLLIQRNLKKKALSSLRQKTDELDQFFNVNLDLLCIANTDGYFLRLNPAAENILGHTREELMAKRFLDFVHPDDLGRTREAVSTLASQQKIVSFENRYRCKDGTYRWLQWSSAPAGKLIYAAGRDVTEHRRSEEALKQSEERFRQVAQNVGDFIWEVDANGLYSYTSPSVEKILGYRHDELVGKKHFYDLFVPEVCEELKAAAFSGFAAKATFRAFPNPSVSKDGRIVHLETSGTPVLDAAGNLVGYRGADTDVTERKRTEEELRKYQEHLEEMVRERTAKLVKAMEQAEAANRARSAFLANMSHELRTPLNSILGIAQLMERDQEFPAKQRKLLEILNRSGQQLFELIDDVLEMSRMEAGQTATVSKTFDLHRFLDNLEEMMGPRVAKKGLGLSFERDSRLPNYIQTDGPKLRQILINLIGNAIKFTEKGWVTLRVNLKDGMDGIPENEGASRVRLVFEVEDTGIGVAQEDMEKIFEPFVQLNPAHGPRAGAGLGLAISQRFAGLLGSEITVRSQVGRGTTFKFNLGVESAEEADIPAEQVRLQVAGLASDQPDYRLLIVDDVWESRLLLRQLLEPVGFRVLEATSGQEAIDMYQKGQPDLICMDIRMPGMDGYEAARRIREAEREKRDEDGEEIHTPIIGLTAGIMEDTGSDFLSGTIDDWVYKPFREMEIFGKLEKHLGVRFFYQPSVQPGTKAEGIKVALTPTDLSNLPSDWLKEFFQMVRRGRSKELMNLIDRIRLEHGDLARALAEQIQIHQFDKLLLIIEETLKDKVNE